MGNLSKLALIVLGAVILVSPYSYHKETPKPTEVPNYDVITNNCRVASNSKINSVQRIGYDFAR